MLIHNITEQTNQYTCNGICSFKVNSNKPMILFIQYSIFTRKTAVRITCKSHIKWLHSNCKRHVRDNRAYELISHSNNLTFQKRSRT